MTTISSLAFVDTTHPMGTMVYRILGKNGLNLDTTAWAFGSGTEEDHRIAVETIGMEPWSEEQMETRSAVEIRDRHLEMVRRAARALGLRLPRPEETSDPARWAGLRG